MNPPLFKIVQGNLPTLNATLKGPTGAPVDLTGATVAIQIQLAPAGINFSGSATVASDPTTGQVSFQFSQGQTDVPGVYQAQWVVTLNGAETIHPTSGYFYFEIVPPLPLPQPTSFTLLSDFFDDIRAITGDFNRRLFQDSAISSVMRTQLRLGRVRVDNHPRHRGGTVVWQLTPDLRGITPAITQEDVLAYALLIYHSAHTLILPNMEAYAYRTRALSERFGERKEFLFNLQNVLYELEDGQGTWVNVNALQNWLFAINGIWVWNFNQAELNVELSFH